MIARRSPRAKTSPRASDRVCVAWTVPSVLARSWEDASMTADSLRRPVQRAVRGAEVGPRRDEVRHRHRRARGHRLVAAVTRRRVAPGTRADCPERATHVAHGRSPAAQGQQERHPSCRDGKPLVCGGGALQPGRGDGSALRAARCALRRLPRSRAGVRPVGGGVWAPASIRSAAAPITASPPGRERALKPSIHASMLRRRPDRSPPPASVSPRSPVACPPAELVAERYSGLFEVLERLAGQAATIVEL